MAKAKQILWAIAEMEDGTFRVMTKPESYNGIMVTGRDLHESEDEAMNDLSLFHSAHRKEDYGVQVNFNTEQPYIVAPIDVGSDGFITLQSYCGGEESGE